MEKRKAERVAKRLEVKFRTNVDNTAITNNISETGLFILTSRGTHSGSVLNIKLNLPDSKELFLVGKVVRSLKSERGQPRRLMSGMGIQLIEPSDHYRNYIQSIRD